VRRLVLLLLLLPFGLSQEEASQRLEARTFEVAEQLRCPVCVSESVAQSSSPTSVEMRRIIQEQLEAGRSEREILTFFQERYGDWILLEPPKRGLHLLVWLLPALAAAVGLTALIVLMRRWTRASREPVEVDEQDLKRVREALAERK
jgi:cytochrome c-type biogenesis protein CcmH